MTVPVRQHRFIPVRLASENYARWNPDVLSALEARGKAMSDRFALLQRQVYQGQPHYRPASSPDRESPVSKLAPQQQPASSASASGER